MTTDQNSPTNWALCTPKFTQQDAKSWHSKCALWFLNRLGWTLRYGGLPAARGVMIVYPHTSNWDYLYGMLGRWALGIPLRYLVKEKLFTGARQAAPLPKLPSACTKQIGFGWPLRQKGRAVIRPILGAVFITLCKLQKCRWSLRLLIMANKNWAYIAP